MRDRRRIGPGQGLLAACLVVGFYVGCSSKTETIMIDKQRTTGSEFVPPPGPYDALDELEVVNDQAYHAMYFKHFGVNPTIDTEEERFSTFSVDVDSASYGIARSYIQRGSLPPEDAVRVEEFINAFDYGYAIPSSEIFHLTAEAFPSPNRPGYQVLHLGIQGREIEAANRKPANLVFVIDVSGSMGMENRLGLVKRSLRMLVGQLEATDTVGIVVYGSHARVVLDPTSGESPGRILRAIEELEPEGATNAQEGIELGYEMAARGFRAGGINRVILCSDGVANMGEATGADSIFAKVEHQAERGITISTIGFGMGNYNDVLMERLAHLGDGNYHYVDRSSEARRVFVENLTATLQVIARDVKIQLEFDPEAVSRYRLLGYENRLLEPEDFDDDAVDAGEIGAGHSVTALYEVRFRHRTGDVGTLRLRYKDPSGGPSRLIERRIRSGVVRRDISEASSPARLSFVVATFAEKLRGSYWVRKVRYEDLESLYRELPAALRSREDVAELGSLVDSAARLDDRTNKFANDQPVAGLEFDRVPILH
ncbi:MAG: von Willebrand factor type A domain-containing protein [Myxococcota bacterium]|nr:von Willebrand factor type A domain-containing protein [Myxococcota bacterium]